MSNLKRELEQLSRLEGDVASSLGLAELEEADHPVIEAAHAVLGPPPKAPWDMLMRADSVKSDAAVPWEFLDAYNGDTESRKVLRYVVSELMRNVDEHAQAPDGGSVRIRCSSNGSQVLVGVADRGIGVRRSLARFHVTPDDRAGIELAVAPGVTGSTARLGGNDINAGAGLFFIRSLAVLTGGCFLLLSGAAAWHVADGSPQEDLATSGSLVALERGRWAGTIVAVTLPVTLPERWSSLFATINIAYERLVKDARQMKRARRSLLG